MYFIILHIQQNIEYEFRWIYTGGGGGLAVDGLCNCNIDNYGVYITVSIPSRPPNQL